MKKLLITMMALLCATGSYAQFKTRLPAVSTPTDSTSFPSFEGGGFEEFRLWVIAKAFPEESQTKGRYQKAVVQFAIDSLGKIREVEPVNIYDNDPTYCKTIIAAMSGSPQWLPATKWGRPVNTLVTMNVWLGELPRSEYTPTHCDVDVCMHTSKNNPESPIMPYFLNGGVDGFIRWMGQEVATLGDTFVMQGVAYLRFIVEKDGSIAEISVISSNNRILAAVAAKVLKRSPRWQPGMKDGKPVRVSYMVPVIVMAPRWQ